ncbi:ATP-dependent Clp protease adaptor protein ClpS [Isosphaera pallida ATCC 43644]|jgi:ATP-dependent Clp protease adaptor protein ClpS|uniref:ATP-dependent Clp protease adaptor protein ClpS n=1 Tax=Isosphaera pallida (strain ATCC 43644 / DSM 9630 / IS1B) TaxID=575540 RepID=E8R2P0_ISOPI|nr:ATP-dependent Clp protease adaptor ClpS [Isosphaera pallida]ADV62540.1 ATP-dependent Clp protease adaptor protein ClpS [Isosphaera pallida ATCC 43644]
MSDSNDYEPDDLGAGTTVTTQSAPKTSTRGLTKTRQLPRYHVIILNDEEHTFEYVIDLLTKVFRHSRPTAEALTWQIHTRGMAIVYTTHKELAELKRDQVLSWGPDPRMEISKTSLACYIEPAD